MNPRKSFTRLTMCLAFLSCEHMIAADAAEKLITGQNTLVNPSTEGISRWFSLDALSFSMRYRDTRNTNGRTIFHDGQERSLVSGKLKLDSEGKYFIGFRISSGQYFNWAYANDIGQNYGDAIAASKKTYSPEHNAIVAPTRSVDPTGRATLSSTKANGWSMYFRDLYMSASPTKALTFEYGAIPIERGAHSEMTTYDEDGYISGGRLRVHLPNYLYADEVSGTWAYLGDLTSPNLFTRGDRFAQNNYSQYLATKHFGKRLKASLDFSHVGDTNTTREATYFSVKESRVLDTARVELYQRLNNVMMPGLLAKKGSGWGFTGSKTLSQKYMLEGGYANIDDYYGVYGGSSLFTAVGLPMNGDAYQDGKRLFVRASVKPISGIGFFGFYTHELDADASKIHYTYNRQGLNAGMTIDFKNLLMKTGLL